MSFLKIIINVDVLVYVLVFVLHYETMKQTHILLELDVSRC